MCIGFYQGRATVGAFHGFHALVECRFRPAFPALDHVGILRVNLLEVLDILQVIQFIDTLVSIGVSDPQ